jgi:hypothetical protein
MESECGRNAQQIVSYRDIQTERKGGFQLIAAGAIEIDAQRRGAHVACGPTAPPAW